MLSALIGPAWVLGGVIALQGAPASPPPAPPPTPARSAVPTLVRDLGRDFVRLPSLDSLIVVGTGSAAGLVAHQSDRRLNDWLVNRPSASYAKAGSAMGDGWLQGGLALSTFAVGALGRHDTVEHIGSDLIRAQIVNAVLTRGLKVVASRTRPSGGPDAMPSGHTSATMATAVVLQEHFGWRVGVPLYAAAGFVGWSRMRDHHHWLSDVVIGASVGLVAGRTVAGGHRGRAWTIVPIASPERAGVAVFWTGR